MKIAFALIRKEADACLSQGRPEEALGLYAKFITGSARIDPGTRSAIETEIQRIELKMNRGDAGATPEPSADRIDPIKGGWGTSAIQSDLPASLPDQVQPPGCSRKHESDTSALDWADGMFDIYALVADDKDRLSSEKLNGKASLNGAEDPKILLNRNSPARKRFHRTNTVMSFLGIMAAFILIGSILLYLVDGHSEIKQDKSAEVVQEAAKIVFKKTPALDGREHKSTFPDNGTGDQEATPSEAAVINEDVTSLVGPAETQAGIKVPSSPANNEKISQSPPSDEVDKDGTGYAEAPAVENNDTRTAPAEPDPASVIDYVLKKRRF